VRANSPPQSNLTSRFGSADRERECHVEAPSYLMIPASPAMNAGLKAPRSSAAFKAHGCGSSRLPPG
jgi:hypothetical protein